MIPSLPLLCCELSVPVKNPDRIKMLLVLLFVFKLLARNEIYKYNNTYHHYINKKPIHSDSCDLTEKNCDEF